MERRETVRGPGNIGNIDVIVIVEAVLQPDGSYKFEYSLKGATAAAGRVA
jgi:hypothetical protein